MPTVNNVINIRKRIAQNYCRSILWLDDEIKPHASDSAGREPYLTFFHPITEEFLKEGVLCQLKGFPQIEGDKDPYATEDDEISICRNLAKMADILILDWHLGAKNPTHASKILDGLIEAGGTRFVIILSQEPNLIAEFEKNYGDRFTKSETVWYRSAKGQFVCLLPKSSFRTTGSGAALIEKIYAELALVYPDYLHWAALEVVSKIKAFSPQWLASLPVDTDLAVLAEKVHSKENIGHALLENLLEDLKEAIEIPSIISINAESLDPAFWPKAGEYQTLLDEDKTLIAGNQSLLDKIKSFIPLGNTPVQPLESRKTARKIFEEGLHLKSIKQFKDSVDSLGQFSEVISHSRPGELATRRGSVFQKTDSTDSKQILVCISQGCDCLREDSLLFLAGQEEASNYEGKAGETFVQFQKTTYTFKALAQSLSTLSPVSSLRWPNGYTHVGVLRQVAVTRLISRYWNQTTRVGIDQPRFLRESRQERE